MLIQSVFFQVQAILQLYELLVFFHSTAKRKCIIILTISKDLCYVQASITVELVM